MFNWYEGDYLPGTKYTILNHHPGWDQYCENKKEYGTSDHDLGSFGEGVVWDANCVIPIPDGYESADAAPLMVRCPQTCYSLGP